MSEIPPEEIPVDLSDLDLRFLPFFLTAERVRIEWLQRLEEWIAAKSVKSFYVGLKFIHGCQYGNDIEPHSLVFRRMRNKNSVRGWHINPYAIKSIIGVGIHNQLPYDKMSMNQIIELKLSQLASIHETYSNWINYKELEKAMMEFNESVY